MKLIACLLALTLVVACSSKAAADLSGDATTTTAVHTKAPPVAVLKSTSKARGSLSTGKKHHPG